MCVNIIQVCASSKKKEPRWKEKAREKAVTIRDARAQSEAVSRPGERAADPGWAFFPGKRETSPHARIATGSHTHHGRSSFAFIHEIELQDGRPSALPLVIIHTNLPAQTAV